MAEKIVVVGSSNTDMILRTPQIPAPGETVLGGVFSMAAGGKGANQAVAAARAGGAVHFVACVGNDAFGAQAIAGFQADGINTDYVRIDGGAASGVALIFVDDAGENSIGVGAGANGLLSPADIRAAEAVIAAADVVLLQLETPLECVEAAALLAKEKGVPVVLNPAPAQPLGDSLLQCVSVLTPNESEAALLTGLRVDTEAACEEAAAILHGRGVATVVITLGARGAYVAGPAFCGMVPGFAAEAVDTTAAGDAFNGALATALAQGADIEAAVRYANAAGALAVTKLGAQPSVPRREEIARLLAEG